MWMKENSMNFFIQLAFQSECGVFLSEMTFEVLFSLMYKIMKQGIR